MNPASPTQASMKHQRGITLGGIFIFMMLIGFLAYIAARVLPGYMDYWALQRILKNVVEMPEIRDAKESTIRAKFVRELQTNNMTTVNSEDLLVEWIPNGVRISAAFSMKKPFMGPVSLCLDFQAEATSK